MRKRGFVIGFWAAAFSLMLLAGCGQQERQELPGEDAVFQKLSEDKKWNMSFDHDTFMTISKGSYKASLLDSASSALPKPVLGRVSETADGEGIYLRVTWDAVAGAEGYEVYAQDKYMEETAWREPEISEVAGCAFEKGYQDDFDLILWVRAFRQGQDGKEYSEWSEPSFGTVGERALPEQLPPFSFSSGVGGWSTELSLKSDGSFEGHYHDSDMGDSGDGYPGGTLYIADFSGKFAKPIRLGGQSWMMELEDVHTDLPEGQTWIEDGIRHIASAPYGVDEGRVFFLYAPGTPLDSLSEEFLSWWPGRYGENSGQTALDCYGLYNTGKGYGFFSYA